ncbi:MAG: fructosamine kinase family protein [Anaerolineales bacterium]|nr:fructosamine kinase family protein [Anaerolineales bacterium]
MQEWLKAAGHGEVQSSRPVSGGCINNGIRLLSESGAGFFLKTNSAAPEGMFAREAEGLAALRAAPTGLRIPRAYLWSGDFLLLEDLAPAERAADYWPQLGRGLAALHSLQSSRFGFDSDNYLGSTLQPNPWTDDGYEFLARQRLLYQARLARDGGRLDAADIMAIERLAGRLPELLPAQPAVLIHGDLWAGNAISDAAGGPALIDPAAHYGWAEAELGMTALFGGFAPEFYAAYEEATPLQPDWRERLPIYNLYHLLNHLNLFGAGYLGQVQAVLSRFA